jgi:hypothetical protein
LAAISIPNAEGDRFRVGTGPRGSTARCRGGKHDGDRKTSGETDASTAIQPRAILRDGQVDIESLAGELSRVARNNASPRTTKHQDEWQSE